MDVLSLLFELVLRSLFLLMPMAVAGLALRRLLRSQSANAWLYGAVCLFTAVAAAAMVPWTLGLADAAWPAFAAALISPGLWVGVLMICDPSRDTAHYDKDLTDDPWTPPDFGTLHLTQAIEAARAAPGVPAPDPDPDRVPIFRHRPPANLETAPPVPLQRTGQQAAPDDRSLMSVARDMRGGHSSERRRPLLLPPPDAVGTDLPFLRRR